MTKSKVINKYGKVLRIDLHPSKVQIDYYNESFRKAIFYLGRIGYTLVNRKMAA